MRSNKYYRMQVWCPWSVFYLWYLSLRKSIQISGRRKRFRPFQIHMFMICMHLSTQS